MAKLHQMYSELHTFVDWIKIYWTWEAFRVLYICVDFGLLAHLLRDSSQAEKKTPVLTSWATDKMTIFTQNAKCQQPKFKTDVENLGFLVISITLSGKYSTLQIHTYIRCSVLYFPDSTEGLLSTKNTAD